MHLSERLAVHGRLGNKDVLADHRHVLFLPFDALFRSDEDTDCLCIVLSTSDEHLVPLVDNGVTIRDADVTILQDTAANKVATKELANLKNCTPCQVSILHDKCHAMRCGVRIGSQFLFYLLLLVFQTDSAKETKSNGCSYNAYNAKWIGTCIAVGNGRSVHSEDLIAGLRSSTKARGIGNGSAKHAYHHGEFA